MVEIHAAGLAHQFVNPHNVLVINDGLIRLRGYGRTYRYDACGCDVVSVPTYREPVFYNGSLLDLELLQSSDIFSLGVITYQLFTRDFSDTGFAFPRLDNLNEDFRSLISEMVRSSASDRPNAATVLYCIEVLISRRGYKDEIKLRSPEEQVPTTVRERWFAEYCYEHLLLSITPMEMPTVRDVILKVEKPIESRVTKVNDVIGNHAVRCCCHFTDLIVGPQGC